MASRVPNSRSHVTLALCALLHAFTHALGQLLVPLYLLIVSDLKLGGVRAASLIVTVYGLSYCSASYIAGILADRFNRKMLLGFGLLLNGLAVCAMGLTRRYEMLIALGIIGGLFGTMFHPAANAMVPAHYPKSPGMAIGLLGMGSGLGFFFGPQYSGWRAENAGWHLWAIADWQRPCIEMGLAGVVVAVIFLIMAREAPRSESEPSEDAMLPNRVGIEAIVTGLRGPHERHHPHLVPALRKKVIAIGAVLSLRDFVGIATITLISVFLQKAYSYTPKQAGFAVGGMMLISTIINPLSVYASAGRHRLPALAVILVIGGLILMVVPLLSIGWVLPVMCVFQAFQFGSYAVSDAAILERVSPNVRGRVVGLFLTLAGTFASLSPWVMGFWTDLLGERAHTPMAYFPIFATLGGMMILASYSPRLIARLTETPQIKMPSVNANQASMLPNISS